MIRRTALASVLLFACAAPAHPAVQARPSSAAPSAAYVTSSSPPPSNAPPSSSLPSPPPAEDSVASSEPPPPALPACNADGFGFAVETPYDLPCDDRMDCRGAPRFRVRNCREDGALEVQLRIGPPGDAPQTLIDFAPVEPGHDVIFPLRVGRGGAFAVSARFTADDGLDAAVMTNLIVTASVRDRAVAACEACHGEWGRHGMMQIESCICRTADAGRECEDARDCEGECLATGHRVVRRGHGPRRLPNGTISVAETLAVAIGRCSEFRAAFGCHAYVPEGARAGGPQPIRMLPRASICRD
jgi:hypothetical protein